MKVFRTYHQDVYLEEYSGQDPMISAIRWPSRMALFAVRLLHGAGRRLMSALFQWRAPTSPKKGCIAKASGEEIFTGGVRLIPGCLGSILGVSPRIGPAPPGRVGKLPTTRPLMVFAFRYDGGSTGPQPDDL